MLLDVKARLAMRSAEDDFFGTFLATESSELCYHLMIGNRSGISERLGCIVGVSAQIY